MQQNFVLKGNVLYSKTKQEIASFPNHYLVCENGMVAGVFAQLPEKYASFPLEDCGNRLIIPGLVDLHLHAPQYSFRSMGMDLELLEWLNTNTFPEESKYRELAYAEKAYSIFVDAMKNGATTRACMFATIHNPATLLLMDKLEATGLATMVGKVNMDRNSPDELREESAKASLADTKEWLETCKTRYQHTRPILTPRFVPSCTDELMHGLGALQKETGLPVQSHLSENFSEISWVAELCPDSENYGDAYLKRGLFGGENCPTIMAHCVHSGPEEVELMAQRDVFVAHCAASNANLSSGIAPVRKYMDKNLKMGLGTDIAGGFSACIFRAMADAIMFSKMHWRLVDEADAPLTVPEAFYLGTKGGGEFFGKVGSFEQGYEFDAVVLDDTSLPAPNELTPMQRLERLVYMAQDQNVVAKYAAGRKVK